MEELTVVAIRRRYSAATWKERIAACRSSGQTVAEWCSSNGISSKTYYRWERKLLREARQELCCTRQPQLIQRFAGIPQVTCATYVVAVLHAGEITCEPRQGITVPEGMSDKELAEKLFPGTAGKTVFKMQDYAHVHREMQKRAMSVASLSPPTPCTALMSLLSVALSSVTAKSNFMIPSDSFGVNIQSARKPCSISPETMLNFSGIDAQLRRFGYAISAVYASWAFGVLH